MAPSSQRLRLVFEHATFAARYSSFRALAQAMLWLTRTHEALLDEALKYLVDAQTLLALKAASQRQDSLVGGQQGAGRSFMHSMAQDGEPPAEARARRDAFIALSLAHARVLAGTDRGAALQELGAAFHAMMDATSPAHTDAAGDPLEWHGPLHPFEAVHHAWLESGDPAPATRARVVERMRRAYESVFESLPHGPWSPRDRAEVLGEW